MIGYYGPKEFNSKQEIVDYLNLSTESIKLAAVDVETISLENLTPVGIGVAISRDEGFYFTMNPDMEESIPWRILMSKEVKKVYHNVLFDLSALDEFQPDDENIACTLIMAHLLNLPGDLESLSNLVGMEAHDMKEYMVEHKAKTTLELPLELLAKKCCQDVKATYALYQELLPRTNQQYFEVEMDVVPILVEMSMRGLRIDQQMRQSLEYKYAEDAEFYKGECNRFGFNPASPQQVGYTLAERRNILPMRRKRNKAGKWVTSYTTDNKVLGKLTDPLAQLILGYRDSSKALSTYLKPYRNYTRVYTRWHIDAVTGRISSTHRNLQNIPPDLRGMFVPDNGVFTDWDANQIELRTLAYMSKDSEMNYVYSQPEFLPNGNRNPKADIHQATADFMGIDRKIAKNTGFAMIYGATPETIMETAGITNLRRAVELRDSWMDKYREAGEWIMEQQSNGLSSGYIETLYGRRIVLPVGSESEQGIRRKAVNYPIQGSAAEIIKRAMIRCRKLPLVLQVHDELVADGDVALEVISLGLDSIGPFPTPFKVKLVERWE